jgi:hypothetical protein
MLLVGPPDGRGSRLEAERALVRPSTVAPRSRSQPRMRRGRPSRARGRLRADRWARCACKAELRGCLFAIVRPTCAAAAAGAWLQSDSPSFRRFRRDAPTAPRVARGSWSEAVGRTPTTFAPRDGSSELCTSAIPERARAAAHRPGDCFHRAPSVGSALTRVLVLTAGHGWRLKFKGGR